MDDDECPHGLTLTTCGYCKKPAVRPAAPTARPSRRRAAASPGDADRQAPSIPRGTHCHTGGELVALLTDWATSTDDETIGDVTHFSRAPWISVDTPAGLMDLNADTRRAAVGAFLEHAARAEGAFILHVVANQNGKFNKIVLDPNRPPVTGWYAYLRLELDGPRSFMLT